MTELDDTLAGNGPLADVLGQIRISLGHVAVGMQAQADVLSRLSMLPLRFEALGVQVGETTSVVPADGQGIFDLGGPAVGRYWDVRALRVSDAGDVTATMAGRADFFVGKTVPGDIPFPTTAWRWTFGLLPSVVTLSSESVSVIPPDRLYCQVTQAGGGSSVLAAASVLDISVLARTFTEVG